MIQQLPGSHGVRSAGDTRPTLGLLVPSLRESVRQISLTISAVDAASRRVGLLLTDLILFDGGSSVSRLLQLQSLADSLSREYFRVRVVGVAVGARPNKNLAVAYATKLCSAGSLVVVDADFQDISEGSVSSFFASVRARPDAFVLPHIKLLVGRDNHLIGAPMLRCFWPDLFATVQQPFPGIYGGPIAVFRRVVESGAYHLDWGGELDLLLGFWEQGCAVEAPAVSVTAHRHREVSSKVRDGFQMVRAGLNRARSHQLDAWYWHNYISRIAHQFPTEAERFSTFARDVLGIMGRRPMDTVAQELRRCGTPARIRDWLISVSRRSGRLEPLLIAAMVQAPVAYFIEGVRLPVPHMAISPEDMRTLNLADASIMCDILLASAIVSRASSLSAVMSRLERPNHPAFQYGSEDSALHQRRPTGFDLRAFSLSDLEMYASGHKDEVSHAQRNRRLAAIVPRQVGTRQQLLTKSHLKIG